MRTLASVAMMLGLGSGPAWSTDYATNQPMLAELQAYVQTVATRAGERWRRYVDDRYGFAIDLPGSLFDPIERTDRGISLRAPRYGAMIEVYAAENPEGFSPREFVAAIEEADRVRQVTYRAGGKSWFVLSGFYSAREGGDAVIFYTKFMFSPDRSRLAAFEISFPARQKPRFAPIVEHIEDSFTGPRR